MLLFLARLAPKLRTHGSVPGKNSTRAKVKPVLEQLEDRTVCSVSYFSYASGTWAYNHDNAQWRKITAARPTNMVAMHDGPVNAPLYASYASGLWSYSYDNNSWKKLTAAVPIAMDSGSPTLYASFKTGTFQFDGTNWTKLSSAVASQIDAIGPFGAFYAVYTSGLWQYQGYNNSWTKILAQAPRDVECNGSSLVVVLNTGTWRKTFDGWEKLTAAVASQIVMYNNDYFYATYASGTWRYNNGTWTKLTSAVASRIEEVEKGYQEPVFVGIFSSGTWIYNNGWTKITGAQASLVA